MAKDVEQDDDDDKFEKLDEETLGFLEQVRKGKARNFVLSMKGNKVRSMIVKKKPIKEKDRKAARGEGFQPVFGVATGMGAAITFTIARADGFDEKQASCKTEKLKKFLSAQTGKMFKPEFQLVDAAPPIPFDEDDLADPLIAKFMKLEPVITKACDTKPDSIPVIQESVNTIRSLLQDEETRPQAAPKLDEFIQFLKDLLGAKPTAPTAAPSAAATDTAALAAKLAEALKKLKPLVDRVIDADPNRKGELHATMVQIAGEIKAKQFDQAKQNVTVFATLLKSLAAQQAAPAASQSMDRMTEFAARRDALEPRLLEAQQADREKATKLGAVWNYANEQAQTGNFENAFKALDRLADALAKVLADAKPTEQVPPGAGESTSQQVPVSNVALQQCLLAWDDARKKTHADLVELEQGILELFSDDSRLAEVTQKTRKLDAVLGDYAEELRDRLDDAYNAPAEYKPEMCSEAVGVLGRYRTYLSTDPFIKAVAGNLLLPIDIEGVLGKTLDDVARTLGA